MLEQGLKVADRELALDLKSLASDLHDGPVPAVPQLPQPLEGLISSAISEPLKYLRSNGEGVVGHSLADIGVSIADDRCALPILGRRSASEGVDAPVTVVANGGAQLSNSSVFLGASAEDRKILREMEESTASMMLGFSRAHDILVCNSSRPEVAKKLLDLIGRSFAEVALEVSSTYEFVDSISAFIRTYSSERPILPNLLEPALLERYQDTEQARGWARSTALANIAAYTKHGAESWWSEAGLPTPRTEYLDLEKMDAGLAARELQIRFAEYAQLVVNLTGGSGGHSIYKLETRALTGALLTELFGDGLIQAQGFLDVKFSPCVIAALDDNEPRILGVSVQKFHHGFGIHSGNSWNSELWEQLGREYPDLPGVTQRALVALKDGGVRGQINIDIMCISEEERRERNLLSNAVLREANIRPAGSSVYLRLREGTIDGEKISQISSVTGMGLNLGLDLNENVLAVIEKHRTSGLTHAVLYAVNPVARSGAIAFLASDRCSREAMEQFERSVLSDLRQIHGS